MGKRGPLGKRGPTADLAADRRPLPALWELKEQDLNGGCSNGLYIPYKNGTPTPTPILGYGITSISLPATAIEWNYTLVRAIGNKIYWIILLYYYYDLRRILRRTFCI